MQKPNERLVNQTAIVTGGNGGIGKAVCMALALDGANVVINYLTSPEVAEEIAHEINENSSCGKAIAIKANVADEQQVEDMFKQTIEKFGTVDIVVPNSGIQQDAHLHEMTLQQWQKVIDVNLTGQFLCARAGVREFLRRGVREGVSKASGKIIHMSSVHQQIAWSGHPNYAATKGAINMLMQSIAQGYGPYKVRCNSIAPGAIQTPINKSAWDNQESLDNLMKLIPYKRIGKPEDIGSTAAWLASDESDYINGATIFVDGAMTCYPGFTENG